MKKFLLLFVSLTLSLSIFADEGMWLLPLLKKTNIKDMRAHGLKLSAEEIYSLNKNSLKDAIVIFGGGCTGEVVSPEGLVFTNHHCGFSSIQALSSVEHDYLKNGYWAMDRSQELPAPGLSVRFVRSIEDVSKKVLKGVKDDMPEKERNAKIDENRKELEEALKKANAGKQILVRDFFGGNQFFAFVIETYNDIRFVGAPPSSIGKFGGDTDNWMWPRHTCDFSVFRIYAAPDGVTPAAYSTDNVPYKAPVHLTVSTKGYKEGDFAMIIGFPGSTERYMTSYEIDDMLNVSNPNRIYIRGERQKILSERMATSDKIRIQYASKYASSSNYWKNAIGMSRGIKKLGVKAEKEAEEKAFAAWVNEKPSRVKEYGNALTLLRESTAELSPVDSEMQVLSEAVLRSIEMSGIARSVNTAIARGATTDKIKSGAADLYKDFDLETDRQVAIRMLEIVKEMLPAERLPEFYKTIDIYFGGDISAFVNDMYSKSVFTSQERFESVADQPDVLKNDPAAKLGNSVYEQYAALRKSRVAAMARFDEGHRLFIKGLMEMYPKKSFYPDANSTIRLTYGNIEPYSPADGVEYKYYTTLKGVIDKEDPTNPIDFTVPDKLKELYAAGDWGRYGDSDGKLHACFLSNNDITGGNSGSPVMNANGHLIGLAFDGNWEAMSGDVAFEPDLQRCINVDVRYVLFIIDRFGGAGWLLNEMTID